MDNFLPSNGHAFSLLEGWPGKRLEILRVARGQRSEPICEVRKVCELRVTLLWICLRWVNLGHSATCTPWHVLLPPSMVNLGNIYRHIKVKSYVGLTIYGVMRWYTSGMYFMSLCISSCDFAFASRYQFCTDFSKELRVVESRLEAGRHCWMLWHAAEIVHWVLKLQPDIWWICSKVGQVLDSRFPHLPLEPWECWVSIEEFSIIFQFVCVSSEFSICFHAWSCFLFGFSMILISFEAMKAAFEEFVANRSSRIEAGIVFQSLRVNLRRLAIPAKVWKIEAWRNRLRFLSVLRGIFVFLMLNLQGWSSHLQRCHP